MDRRTFVLLAGAASTGWGRLVAAPARLPAPSRTSGRLRFELDERRRWSLWYYDEPPAVPLIRDAELVAWVGEHPLTLAQLEDSTVGSRRPPGGDAVVVRGRAAGVWIEAEFLTERDASAPRATITVTVFPDRYLPTVAGVRFFRVPAAALLTGDGRLHALVNGYDSGDPCRLVTVASAPALTSHGAAGLTRGGCGLGLAFDAGGPGEAAVRLSREECEAVSDWLPSRPLHPEGDVARLRLAYEPTADGLNALRAALIPTSPLDRERLARAVAPAGWRPPAELAAAMSEPDVVAQAQFCAAQFDRRFFRYVQVGDGYQRAAGDWEANERFPHGHRWLSDQIHASGFKAGLWVAPFAVAERSGVPNAHPDWLLRDAAGPIAWTTRARWGGKVYALDGAHPQVQEWLRALAQAAVRDWGYDYLEIDYLRCATLGTGHYGSLTHAEAYRAGLAALRDGLGTEATLVGGGAPLEQAVGLVNGMRVGPEGSGGWDGLHAPARTAGLRSFYHRAAWLSDPGALLVGPPLSALEAAAWTALVAVMGGATWLSENLPALAPERLALVRRALPVAPVAGRPVGALAPTSDVAPGIVAGDSVYSIGGPWRFRIGDDTAYATRGFDEAGWELMPVPGRWADAGHPDYGGVAWYRARFQLPAAGAPPDPARVAYLELGRVDAADETFVNGARVGATGAFSDDARSEATTYRRYRVTPSLLNWGGDNVVAVRVSAPAGLGGIWSVAGDRPPSAWAAEGAPRWWTVVLVNWDEEAHDAALPLGALGLGGVACDVYDVDRDTPLTPGSERLAASVEPHAARTLAVRPRARWPQVIGTTRHIVQGAVDVTEETWDAATGTLHAKSVNLDDRAYAVTIAVPAGWRPGPARADPACAVRRLKSGHVVLEWPAGGDGRDIAWNLRFRAGPATHKPRGT